MPDLTIVNMRQCKQLSQHNFEVSRYHVFIDSRFVNCDCPAFTYKKGLDKNGHCKHIRQVLANQCSWHEQFDGPCGPDNKCPRCGGETEVVRVGV